LSAAHGGLPAGSEIVIGNDQATAVADISAPSRPTRPGTGPRPTTPGGRPNRPSAPEPDVGGEVPGGPVRVAPGNQRAALVGRLRLPRLRHGVLRRQLSERREADVSGGWHHGEDIFAAAGTPLLAVADGTCTRSGSTGSAGTGSGCETHRATSSTTHTSPRTHHSRSRGGR
jgi:murein DD-endopeptidase MepM/ murein hydrolase activator NlpD